MFSVWIVLQFCFKNTERSPQSLASVSLLFRFEQAYPVRGYWYIFRKESRNRALVKGQ